MPERRNLTDADVKAIVATLKAEIVDDFKMDVGGGVLAMAKKAIWTILLALAVYGMVQGTGLLPAAAVAK